MDEIQRKLKDVRHDLDELADQRIGDGRSTTEILRELASRLGNVWYLICQERKAKTSQAQTKPSCESCAFWISDEAGSDEAMLGQCRRRSPSPIETADTVPAGEMPSYALTIWPSTESREWCGDFSKKAQPN